MQEIECFPAGVWDQTLDVPGQLTGVLDILYHPNQPHKMLLQGAAHRHWVTEDYGGSFRYRLCILDVHSKQVGK